MNRLDLEKELREVEEAEKLIREHEGKVFRSLSGLMVEISREEALKYLQERREVIEALLNSISAQLPEGQ